MNQIIGIIACLYGISGIVLGTFGAHVLKNKKSQEELRNFETGVKYQMYHALLLLYLSAALSFKNPFEKYSVLCIVLGCFCFSFSIYALVLMDKKTKKRRFIGPITPLGGLLLVSGWVFLACSLF